MELLAAKIACSRFNNTPKKTIKTLESKNGLSEDTSDPIIIPRRAIMARIRFWL